MKHENQRPAAGTATETVVRDKWSERWEMVVEKIDRLDVEVEKYKEQIKKTRPGPAQEVVKARARRKLKQKKAYEMQRDILHSRSFGENQVSSAKERINDSKQKKKQHKSTAKQSSRSFLCVLLPRCCILS